MRYAILSLLLLLSSVTAFSVTPESLVENVSAGDILIRYFNVTGTITNTTETVNITTAGTVGGWTTTDKSQLTVNETTTKTFKALIQIPANTSSGAYTGELNLITSSTTEVALWLIVEAINTTTTTTQTTNVTGKLRFLTTTFGKTLQQGVQTTEAFYLRNDMSTPVDLKKLYTRGTVVTAKGEKPIRIEEYTLKVLSPKDELKLSIIIDATDIKTGVYSPELVVAGYSGDEPVEAHLYFDISIVTAPEPGETTLTTPLLTAPKTSEVNKDFELKITNLPKGADIDMGYVANLEGDGGSQLDSTWTYIGRFTKAGNYTVRLIVKKNGGIVKTLTTTIVAYVGEEPEVTNTTSTKTIKIDFSPDVCGKSPMSEEDIGETCTVSATDADTGASLTNAVIKINDLQMKTFVAEAGKTFEIKVTATGYAEATSKIVVPAKKLIIQLSPSKPQLGDNVTITVKDSKGNDKTAAAVIKVNDVEYVGAFEIKEAEYTITAELEGYAKATSKITISIELDVTSIKPENPITGENVTIVLSKSANWEIISPEGESLTKGTGKKIVFIPDKDGTYDLTLNNKRYATIEVNKPGFTLPQVAISELSPKQALGMIIVIILVLAILIKTDYVQEILKAKKRKKVNVIYRKPAGALEEPPEKEIGG